MKPSENLRNIRAKSGRSPHDIATAIGISSPEYYDLESNDDLETCLALGKIKALAAFFDIRITALFSDKQLDDVINPSKLALLLNNMIAERGIALSDAETEIGWTIGPFLKDPATAILDWNITCLRDVCAAVKCNWMAVLSGIESSSGNQ